MAGKANGPATDFVNYMFLGAALPNYGSGNFYISLHTADPTASGNQTTNETTYTGYARQLVTRTSSDWSVSGQTASNINIIQFPLDTAGTGTITHVGIGTAATGTGELIYYGPLVLPLSIGIGSQPQFTAGGNLTITEA